MSPERFTKTVVEVIAKRSANICSNPDCMALTSGPSTEENSSVNVGEAAHVYGARPGSCRFREGMSDEDRSDITNAIWLCRNCHKLIDSDVARFPPELLFEWRRAHEQEISKSLGKAGAVLREKVTARLLQGLDRCSYLAQQIIIDKPRFWEYRLTAELLRDWLEPIKFRWDALRQGLYHRPLDRIVEADCLGWLSEQLGGLTAQTNAISALLNNETARAWGPPGQPGSVLEIYRVSSLIAEACQRILDWEERVRFCHVPAIWEEAKDLLVGIAGKQIQQIFEVPSWISSIISQPNPEGVHNFVVKFALPDDWSKKYVDAVKRAVKK